jgi:hypothetical protein
VLFAAAVAVVAVALGLVLGLVPAGRARVAGPLRTFALSAALTVVLAHLLPEAFSELGILALFLFAATSVLPAWLGLGRALSGSRGHGEGHSHGGLFAGYVGLLVHHVGDGLGLGAYASLPGGALRHADVMLALAVHTVPLVAVVAFAFQRTGGSRRALHAAAGLAGASVLGVVFSGIVPSALVERFSAWVAALVAGLLVHVVTHDLERDLPTSFGGRAIDFVAAILGVATSLVGGEHGAGKHPSSFATVALSVLTTLSLPMLAGWVLATLAATRKKGTFTKALGAAFGATLGVDALVMAYWIGGFVYAAFFAAFAYVVVGAVRGLSKADPEALPAPREPPPGAPLLIRLDDLVSDSLPWILSSFAFFALVMSSLPVRALEGMPLPLAIAAAVIVAVPVRVPAAAAIVIAAALERSGAPFAATLVFALLAPAPGVAELGRVVERRGAKAALTFLAVVVVAAVGFGVIAATSGAWLVDDLKPPFRELTSQFAFYLVGILALRAAFDRGLRGFLLEVFPSHDTAHPPEPEPHAHAR